MARKQARIYEGTVSVHRRGFGFVKVGEEDLEDFFVGPTSLAGAVDGDRVKVEMVHPGRNGKGPEGKVVEVIERARTRFGGTVVGAGALATVSAPALARNQQVLVDAMGKPLNEGDRILFEVTEWGTEMRATLVEVLGTIDDPSIDVDAACLEYGLDREFPPDVVAEAKKYGDQVTKGDLKGREDLRKVETVTIDPRTAKDFDDALSLSKDRKGHYHLQVHIADVTHYVGQGSALDETARARCNSTYFPGKVVPMLPRELSNELCSLKPNVDRLVATVKMEFDKKGSLCNYSIGRSVIHSDKRFSYEEAKEVIDGKLKSPHAPLINRMVELCNLLKEQRRWRGSIEFALPEVSIEVNEGGEPMGTRYIEYDITHQMVEEFMLKANEMVARHLSELGKGLTYRVHDMPTEDDLGSFYALAEVFGFRLPRDPSMEDLQKLFDEAYKTEFGAQLAVSFIRSMKMATYSPDNIGHYGLSLEHYCHFTSPIRRYADVVVHRVLLGDGYSEDEIEAIALRCSEQERISARAEGDVVRLKKLRLLSRQIHEGFDAVVTGVKSAGIVFDLSGLMFEGFIHISELGDDYYEFNEQRAHLIGRKSGQRFAVGTAVRVELISVDLVHREATWIMA